MSSNRVEQKHTNKDKADRRAVPMGYTLGEIVLGNILYEFGIKLDRIHSLTLLRSPVAAKEAKEKLLIDLATTVYDIISFEVDDASMNALVNRLLSKYSELNYCIDELLAFANSSASLQE